MKSTPGTHGKKGDVPAEQNHASVVHHLGKNYTGKLAELFMQLLDHHQILTLKLNRIITKSYLDIQNIRYKLSKRNNNNDLLEASKVLCLPDFSEYCKAVKQSKHYVVQKQMMELKFFTAVILIKLGLSNQIMIHVIVLIMFHTSKCASINVQC